MPVLDFKCRKCGYKFDELVKNPQNLSKVVCPKCGEGSPERVYEGKCYQSSAKGGCSGHCAGCSGCGH